jgi:GNAT superfamily N-acetyltransferase
MASPTKMCADESASAARPHTHSPLPAPAVLTLRTGTRDDAALLGEMHARSWQSTYRGIMSDAFLEKPVFAERATHWHAKMQEWDAAHGAIWIAQRGDEPIAFANVVDNVEPQYGVYLDHLHVMPGNKGSGAGTLLIRAAEQWAREHGSRRMHLLVWEANLPARGYYEHLGWSCIETFEDQLVDTRAMACRYVHDL